MGSASGGSRPGTTPDRATAEGILLIARSLSSLSTFKASDLPWLGRGVPLVRKCSFLACVLPNTLNALFGRDRPRRNAHVCQFEQVSYTWTVDTRDPKVLMAPRFAMSRLLRACFIPTPHLPEVSTSSASIL